MPRKIKLLRYARDIKIRGQFKGEPDEVRTRMSKREFEKRQLDFNSFYSNEMGGYDYLDFVEWGGSNEGAGRPQIYDNPAIRQKVYRMRRKIKEGKELNNKEIE